MARLGITVAVFLLACLCAAALPYGASGGNGSAMDSTGMKKACDGTLGECEVDEEDEMAGMLQGDALLRRSLARQPTSRYISYAALRADQVPCNKRGRSYYNNCQAQRQANPYQRGCSAITRCERNMN